MWIRNLYSDEVLPADLQFRCRKFLSEISKLNEIEFNCKVYKDDEEVSIYIFAMLRKKPTVLSYCTSKETGRSEFIFAISKPAPLKSKSIPTLELLSIFLAFKCLKTILSTLSCNVKTLNFLIDAQNVLSWLHTGYVKTKNIFAKNRLRDINEMKSAIKSEYTIIPNFTYINTDYNVAMLTKGATYSKFYKKLIFWKKCLFWKNTD